MNSSIYSWQLPFALKRIGKFYHIKYLFASYSVILYSISTSKNDHELYTLYCVSAAKNDWKGLACAYS